MMTAADRYRMPRPAAPTARPQLTLTAADRGNSFYLCAILLGRGELLDLA
jgi:hypothetical protein